MTDRHPAAIACIGAAHIDRKARALLPVALGTSNPVAVTTSHGGVARNVAEGLARLGARVALAGLVGDDAAGDAVAAGLHALGIDTRALFRHEGRPTASYTALLSPSGDLVVALADMGLYDAIDADAIDRALPVLAAYPLWFADANLSGPALARIAAARPGGGFLAADAVSVPKAGRLASLLPRLDLLFLNRDEAAHLAGLGIEGEGGAERAARALLGRGAGAVVLSLGPDGALVADAAGLARVPAAPASVRDVTGAGDALIAGTLFGLARGRPLRAAVALGTAAAALALESEESVPATLDEARLLARAGEGT